MMLSAASPLLHIFVFINSSYQFVNQRLAIFAGNELDPKFSCFNSSRNKVFPLSCEHNCLGLFSLYYKTILIILFGAESIDAKVNTTYSAVLLNALLPLMPVLYWQYRY